MSGLACWACIVVGVVLMVISDGLGSDAMAMFGFVLLMAGFWTLVLS